MATLHAELTRKGPGLLLRDIERGKDKQIKALIALKDAIGPDILFLTKVDFDLEQQTAQALAKTLGYRYVFTLAPNSLVPTPYDLNGDGRTGDRQAWARYAGEGGMLLLSAYPIELMYDLNDLLWKDARDAQMPVTSKGAPFPSKTAQGVQKLVSQGFWVVRVTPPARSAVTLVLFQNQTPVFDGPEDMNALRNRAQLGLVSAVMDGVHGAFPNARFLVIGNTNLDPDAGQGDRKAIRDLLADKRLQDVEPSSVLGGASTAQWERPGPMRVSYILPSCDWQVDRAGVVWPDQGPLRKMAEQASRHRMVWLDVSSSRE